ncbi:hypothetical protein ACLKA7_015835 [Drosophila subpalustris]
MSLIDQSIQPIFLGEAIRLGYPVAGLIVARATGISSNNAALEISFWKEVPNRATEPKSPLFGAGATRRLPAER